MKLFFWTIGSLAAYLAVDLFGGAISAVIGPLFMLALIAGLVVFIIKIGRA